MLGFDATPLRRKFVEQGDFLYLENFLPPEVTAELAAAVAAVGGAVNRNYLPGHKQGGSLSRHTIDELAPFIAELYRSAPLIAWLEEVSGERLHPSPAEDPHAYALYFYTRAGDHIGWHYDTSYYRGFFDGDKLRHRITPIAHGETRISLTFEYVTDPSMRSWWRLISNMKDAVAYFGLRQVFRKSIGARSERP